MNLKLIEKNVTSHSGYGAGSGQEIREEYECPCGKGKVIYEKDDIPGFRESNTQTTCIECDELYNFSRGFAIKK